MAVAVSGEDTRLAARATGTSALGRLSFAPRAAGAALLLVLVVAAGLRLPSLRNPPTDFHLTRQYNGALLAHSYYVDLSSSANRQDRRIATLDRPPVIEPPVLEGLAAVVDLLIGHESLVFPRLVSALAWVLSGLTLFGIARRFLGALGSVTAVGVFELLPFSVLATRSFQPDPLAVAAMLVALLLALRRFERPTPVRVVAAAVGAGVAVLLKADFAPFVLAGYIGAALAARTKWRAGWRSSHGAWFLAALLPGALWSFFASWSRLSLAQRISTYFIAHYLVSGTFWHQLAGEWSGVFGRMLLGVALLGLIVSARQLRGVLVSGAIAYAVFVVAFDYRVATHSYYQLPFIPFVALAAGSAVEWVWRWVAARGFSPMGQRALAVAALCLGAVMVVTQDRLPSSARGREEVAAARVVGAGLCHPEHAVFVDSAYGMPLEYHGDMAGVAWPSPGDLAFLALQGHAQPAAGQRLDSLRVAGSRYVIVTDEVMLGEEPDLARALGSYPLTMHGPGYRVFDMDPSAAPHCAGGPG